jgi:cytochrome c2
VRNRTKYRTDPAAEQEDLMKTVLVVVVVIAVCAGTAQAQNAAAGERVFKRLCLPCHDVGPGAKIKLGPPLNGIDSRKAGTFEGYSYSHSFASTSCTGQCRSGGRSQPHHAARAMLS